VGVVFGLLAALGFGSGDYLGGRASTEVPARVVLLLSQALAVGGALALVLLIHGDLTGADAAYGLAAGAANGTGLGLLYRGLAIGRASLVAPLTALTGAVVPVTWGLVSGERPSAPVLLGIALAVGAGGLITREPDDPSAARAGASTSVTLGVAAGALLGTSFVLFAQTGDGSGMWPVLFARLAGTSMAALAVIARPARGVPLTGSTVRLALAAGVCDVAANAFVVLGIRRDLAVVVAPIASLAPGFTVLWSMLLLRERTGKVQSAGLVLALGGLALIAAG
jgi:drug/metabolite transporter (DMT)-like permease